MTGLCQMIPRESLTLEIPGWFSDLGKLMGKLRAIEWMRLQLICGKRNIVLGNGPKEGMWIVYATEGRKMREKKV